MKRKIVQHGPSTLIISLPKKWTEKRNLKKGDEIEVEEEGNRLIVATEKGKKLGSKTVNISTLNRSAILHLIRGLYRFGYDEITLTFDNAEVLSRRHKKNMPVLTVVHNEVNRLIGWELVEERGDRCVLRDLGGSAQTDYKPIMRRVFRLLHNSIEDFVAATKEHDSTLFATIVERDDTITKFISYCMRIINKYSSATSDILYVYNILAYLDRIGDLLKYSAHDALGIKEKMSAHTTKIFEDVLAAYDMFYDLYYDFSYEKVEKIQECWFIIGDDIKACEKKVPVNEAMLATRLARISDILLVLTEGRLAIEH